MQPGPSTRRHARRCWRQGKIIFNQRSSVFDCAVRKLTREGAELVLNSTLGVPASFELRLDPTGETHFCSIDWRTETEIGVTFQEPVFTPPSKPKRFGASVVALPGIRRTPGG